MSCIFYLDYDFTSNLFYVNLHQLPKTFFRISVGINLFVIYSTWALVNTVWCKDHINDKMNLLGYILNRVAVTPSYN